MLLEPPTKVSQDHINLDVREIEPMLQAPRHGRWRPGRARASRSRTAARCTSAQATLAEAPQLMGYMKRVMEVDHDFYDVVGARVYAELAGWYRKPAEGPLHARRAHRRRMGRVLQRPADERGHQHQPALRGARRGQPHRRDHVLHQVLLRLRDPQATRSSGPPTRATTAGTAGASAWRSRPIRGRMSSTSWAARACST